MASIVLPTADRRLETFEVSASPAWPKRPASAFNRIAYGAVHVVNDPLAPGDPYHRTAVDWDATMAFRRHIWDLGLGVAEAMDTAQRGMGMDWPASRELIERTLLDLPFGPSGIIVCILLATFVLGFFLDWIELTLIILPLVSPVVMNLGFDPVWFTVLFAVCLQTSFLTPPVGFAIFYLKGVAPPEVDVRTLYRGVVPFILLQLLGMVLIFMWEDLVVWLPSVAYG